MKKPLHFIAILAFAAYLFLAGNISPKQGLLTMNTSQASEPAEALSTFCTGRFLLDMPEGSVLSGGNYRYDFARLERPKAMTLEEFESEMAAKEKTLRSIKHQTEPSLLRLLIKPDPHSWIFVYWEESFITSIAQVDGYRWIDGTRYLFKKEAGMSKPRTGTISRQDYAIERMRKILSSLRKRSTHDIPTDPGYCFEDGFIANPEWEMEEAGIDIDIAGHPDAFVSVWFYPLAMRAHSQPLLDRMGGVLQMLGRMATSVHVLRRGDRQVGPYKGQEFLVSAPNSGGMRGHSFIWETEGEGTLDTPALKIELTTGHRAKDGNPQKTRLSDEQAMKLWDDVLNSFRLRPTSDPEKTSQLNPAPSPLLPLGELVATGSICPQTGWWQSSEAGNVEGGRRRHFKAGETMPAVVLLGSPTLWQSLRGKPPTYETATVWTLVAHEKSEDTSLSADQSDDTASGSQT
ncbi:T6SS immunity protein Tli4 family protein [Herbaspirillum rubrisubalbicans]|uniref:T6SS immunity protein Tli4 family protein n=1 Tax=Herbaspirillum rubrisubalbicans TaxID=80842 RepID=UPI0020A1C18C|nr:T6SS immunity protein Tli4 family protein [Herbaspirillum rubrisubalbicans]